MAGKYFKDIIGKYFKQIAGKYCNNKSGPGGTHVGTVSIIIMTDMGTIIITATIHITMLSIADNGCECYDVRDDYDYCVAGTVAVYTKTALRTCDINSCCYMHCLRLNVKAD